MALAIPGKPAVQQRGIPDCIFEDSIVAPNMEAMWRILQADEAGDYVVATGEMHTVREFVEAAFSRVGVTVEWRGEGTSEVGVDSDGALGEPGRILVQVDPRYFRPAEVELLLGDPSKARDELGWEPKVKFCELV